MTILDRRRRRRVAAVAGFSMCLLTSGGGIIQSTAIAYAATQPPVGYSYYVDSTTDTAKMQQLGCDLQAIDAANDYDSAAILDFGGQLAGSQLQLTSGQTLSDSTAEYLASWFAYGYTECWKGNDPHGNILTLAIGTNNSITVNSTTGQDWASVGVTLENDITGYGYAPYVTVYTADDIEGGPNFTPFSEVSSWESGYTSGGYRLLFDYGSTNCPVGSGSGQCGYGWTANDYYLAAWGYGPDYPFPEIYSATLAQEWNSVSAENGGIAFSAGGALSQAWHANS